MNAITLYKVFETTKKNDAPDTTIGLAMFKDEHPEVKITHEEDKTMRQFMGRYATELGKAYPDPVAFTAAVEVGVAADKEAAEKAAETE